MLPARVVSAALQGFLCSRHNLPGVSVRVRAGKALMPRQFATGPGLGYILSMESDAPSDPRSRAKRLQEKALAYSDPELRRLLLQQAKQILEDAEANKDSRELGDTH